MTTLTLLIASWTVLASLVWMADQFRTAPEIHEPEPFIPLPEPLPADLEIVVLVVNQERYIVVYTDEQRDMAALKLGQWASDPELSLTMREAAAGIARVRGNKWDEECCGVGIVGLD